MTQQVHILWIISLVYAVTLAAAGGDGLAQAQVAEAAATVQANLKQPTAAEPTKPAAVTAGTPSVDVREIKIDGRPIRGARDAKVTVIEFDDFQCPFSARMHTALSEVMNHYGDRIRLVTRDAPNILIHPWSIRAAVNANCLASQSADAYWDFSDYVFANQNQINSAGKQDAQFAALDKLAAEAGQKHQLEPAALEQCLQAESDTEVTQSRRDAKEKVGIAGVPTLFINGEKITGVMTSQQLRERLDGALDSVAHPVPTSTTNTAPPAAAVAPSPAPSQQDIPIQPHL
jgi:protein-disulfide isomerase